MRSVVKETLSLQKPYLRRSKGGSFHMPKNQIVDTINPRTLLFMPRQVLLSEANMKSNPTTKHHRTLKPEQKTSLLHSIAGYLQSNDFSKTLKKFRSEAHLEKDDHSESIISLEDVFCNYLDTGDHGGSSFSGQKELDSQMDGNSARDKEADFAAGAEIVSKKIKKRCDEDGRAIVGHSDDNTVLELNLKSKDKKKKKKTSDSQGQLEQVSAEDAMKEPVDSVVCDQQLQEPDKKHKDKKKRKSKSGSESVIENVECRENVKELDVGKSSTTESKKDDGKTLDKDATDKESKQSKKRKRLASEENNSQPIDKNEVEVLKHRKTKGSEELKGSEQVTELNGTMGNSNIKKEGEKSASHKSMKKQANGSAEPKTLQAFQRVKVDEVVFTDERLKDNSYWAKEGAEIGYGAKAQEVLGQVRGRDFRHEKTKKKRGSYRGGLIDVQSHSIKFNYSDEE